MRGADARMLVQPAPYLRFAAPLLTSALDITQDARLDDNLTTKPTLETLLEMMRAMRDNMNERFDATDRRFDVADARFHTLNGRMSELDIRIDGMNSWAHKAYSAMTDLRADFSESKVRLKERLPSPK
jgi:hypothetical protein